MLFRITAILLTIFSLGLPAHGESSAPTCENRFLTDLQTSDLQNRSEESDTLTYEAFEVVGRNPGIHGGQRTVVRRTGSWFDFEKELKKKGDLVIDLRFFPHVLGEREAHFFGFEVLDDHHISLPNVEEINGAIEKYNSLLPEDDPRRILLRYYSIPEVHNTVHEYVTMFRDNLAIPISSNRKSYFHDVSAHSMQGLFVDNLVIQAIQQRVELAFAAVEHVKAKFRGTAEEPRAKRLSSSIKGQLAGLIDQIGAFVSLAPNKEMRDYFGRIGIEHYNEGVSSGNQNQLDENWRQMIEDNGAIHKIAFFHFDWILSDDFESYFNKEVRDTLATKYSRYRGLRELETAVMEALQEFFDQNRSQLNELYGLKRMIDDARELEKSLRVFAFPPRSPSRLQRAVERVGRFLSRRRPSEPDIDLTPIDSDLINDFERNLSTHESMRAYVNRLIFLRRNLTELSGE